MRRVFIALLAMASVPAIAAEEPKLPADVQARIDEANAKKAEAEAKEAQYKAEAEAAKARFDALPKSPAEGKTELTASGGKLETNLLVASAFQAAAKSILEDKKLKASPESGRILVIAGTDSLDRSHTMAFNAQVYALESAFAVAGIDLDDCATRPGTGPTALMFDPTTAMAALGALADLLKTDISISGIDSDLDEASLVRAVAAGDPQRFTTTFKAPELTQGKVPQTLCRLLSGRVKSEVALKLLGADAEKNHPREYATLTQTNKAYDDFLGQLTTGANDKAPPLAAILAESVIDTYPNRILRVWTDARGGTVIQRKSLWTMLGARSVGMTGGAVVSYLLTDKTDGNVHAAGFLHCNTKLVSLRTAHKDAFAQGYCEATIAK